MTLSDWLIMDLARSDDLVMDGDVRRAGALYPQLTVVSESSLPPGPYNIMSTSAQDWQYPTQAALGWRWLLLR